MKKTMLILAGLALTFGTAARADGPMHCFAMMNDPLVECQLLKPEGRLFMDVSIVNHACPGITATVSVPGPTDAPVAIVNTKVQEHVSTIPGGGITFSGIEFELELVTDAARLPDGGIYSYLTFENDGERVVREMDCKLINLHSLAF